MHWHWLGRSRTVTVVLTTWKAVYMHVVVQHRSYFGIRYTTGLLHDTLAYDADWNL
jgi:hypothetical protein